MGFLHAFSTKNGNFCAWAPKTNYIFIFQRRNRNFFFTSEFLEGSKYPNCSIFKPVSWPYFSIHFAENQYAQSFSLTGTVLGSLSQSMKANFKLIFEYKSKDYCLLARKHPMLILISLKMISFSQKMHGCCFG